MRKKCSIVKDYFLVLVFDLFEIYVKNNKNEFK